MKELLVRVSTLFLFRRFLDWKLELFLCWMAFIFFIFFFLEGDANTMFVLQTGMFCSASFTKWNQDLEKLQPTTTIWRIEDYITVARRSLELGSS
jgi:hypothetical protein